MDKDELKRIRLKVGFSQREMAQLIGCPMRTYQNWEYGINRVPYWLSWMLSSIPLIARNI